MSWIDPQNWATGIFVLAVATSLLWAAVVMARMAAETERLDREMFGADLPERAPSFWGWIGERIVDREERNKQHGNH